MSNYLPSKSFTFTNKEKLKLRKDIKKLFQSGKAFSIESIRVVYLISDIEFTSLNNNAATQIGISVPKKRFKKAVCRNLLKRRIREAWRLQKNSLFNFIPNNKQLQLFFIYQDNKKLPYSSIYQSMTAVIEKLILILNKELSIKE